LQEGPGNWTFRLAASGWGLELPSGFQVAPCLHLRLLQPDYYGII